MTTLALVRFALCTSVAVALLAGCSGSQLPIGAPGAMPQSRAVATHADRSGSWMLPEAKGEDLLYAVRDPNIYILSYPAGKEVGMLEHGTGLYLCADANNGHVFVTDGNVIYEYAHAGTKIIRTIDASSQSYFFLGCSVDPTTGNLAVANLKGGQGNIAIYAKTGDTPTTYLDPNVEYFSFCGYDNKGNLFVDGLFGGGTSLAELPRGSSSISDISLSEDIEPYPGSVQWDGAYVAVESGPRHSRVTIYRVNVSGSTGTIVGTTQLVGGAPSPLSFLDGNAVVAAHGALEGHHGRALGFWDYPAGGKAFEILRGVMAGGRASFGDVTISVARK
jgi:hypothetical protein